MFWITALSHQRTSPRQMACHPINGHFSLIPLAIIVFLIDRVLVVERCCCCEISVSDCCEMTYGFR